MIELDDDGVGKRRYASSEVRDDGRRDVGHIDRITAGWAADPLEAVRHTFQPLNVVAHVRHGLRHERVCFALP